MLVQVVVVGIVVNSCIVTHRKMSFRCRRRRRNLDVTYLFIDDKHQHVHLNSEQIA